MTRTVRVLDALIEGGLIGLLVFAPLPFGSVIPWAQAVIEGAVALLVALWVARMLVSGEVAIRLTPLLWPALAMTAVIGLQLLRPAGSASPYATWESARLYAAYVGLLLVLGGHLTSKARILRLVSILIGWGVILAGFGLTNRILGREVVLWFPKEAYHGRLTSTFINANHQALYFSVLLFLVLGLLLRPRKRAGRSGNERGMSGRAGMSATLVPGLPWKVMLGGMIVVIGVALVLTQSRGGLLGTLAGFTVVLGLSFDDRARSRIPLALLAALAAFVLYASWIGLDAVMERFAAFGKEPVVDIRWPIWQATLEMTGNAPVLGVGLGAFEDAFTPYRPSAVPLSKLVEYAHNDYLQLLAEAGIVGVLVMAWALVGLTGFVLRQWAGRRDPFVRGLTMGLLGALGAVVIHSATDFGLHMPANALLLVVVAALLPAVVTLRAHRTGERVDLGEWRRPVGGRARSAGLIVVALATAAALVVVLPPGLADWRLQQAAATAGDAKRAQGDVTLAELGQAQADVEAAARWEPRNPRIQAALAVVADDLARRAWNYGATPDGRRLGSLAVEARLAASQPGFAAAYGAYRLSLQYRPRAAEIHERFGWFLGALEIVRRSVRESALKSAVDPRLAGVLSGAESLIPEGLAQVHEAVQWDPKNAYRYRSLALFALSNLSEEVGARRVAVEALRHALTLEPALLGRVIDDLVARRGDYDLIRESVPRQYALMLTLARELEQRSRFAAATAAFEEALALASEPPQQIEARLAYSRALLGRKNPETALTQARQALVLGPKNPEAFSALSEIYEHTNQLDEAASALASAVSLAATESSERTNDYRAGLASLLARRGDREGALALRRQIVRDLPNNPWAHVEMGRVLAEAGDSSGAFREYQTAQSLGLREWRVQWSVAEAFTRMGYLKEAATAYETAVRLEPTEGDLRVALAELYVRIGFREQAIDQYRRVLASQPDHEGARRGLAAMSVQPVTGAGP